MRSSRRTHSAERAAKTKRPDQKSALKSRYKVRRKIPDPSLRKPEGNGTLDDEQLAMPFVVHKRAEAQPFLKWVGGKASLLRQLEEFLPHEIDRYFEPFLGGGAVSSTSSTASQTCGRSCATVTRNSSTASAPYATALRT
jgi:hypothetical protein